MSGVDERGGRGLGVGVDDVGEVGGKGKARGRKFVFARGKKGTIILSWER